MVEIIDKSKCCGCSACYNICPKKCIKMTEDEEGFLYPVVDKCNCIDCDLCEKTCPCLAERKLEEKMEAYVVQIKDDVILQESSSGGAFTAIAMEIIKRKGIVYGAAFDKEFNVIHKAVTTVEDLEDLRGSKYVQSRVEEIFLEIRDYLNFGKLVCFSGTPCQVEGLKAYLQKDYENLLTVDLVCHGVPSPKLWRKYIQFHQSSKNGDLEAVSFRDKHFGYAGSSMALRFENGKSKYSAPLVQFYKNSYFAGLSIRPSCYSCCFKTIERVSDITIYDCWQVDKYMKELDDDKGTTSVIIHSAYGKELFNIAKRNLRYAKVDVTSIIQSDGDMAVKSTCKNPKRDSFFKDADELPIAELNKKYFPLTIKRCLIIIAKPMITKLKLLNTLKRKIKM